MEAKEKVAASVMMGVMWIAGLATGQPALVENTLLGGFFAVWGLPFAWTGIKTGLRVLGAKIPD